MEAVAGTTVNYIYVIVDKSINEINLINNERI